MKKLKIENLHLGYAEKSVVKNVKLTANEGDFIALIGKNGSGKSTFLKSISGILTPVSGNIYLDKLDITNIPQREIAKYVSIVLTDNILPSLSVWEFVSLGRQRFTNLFDQLNQKDKLAIEQVLERLKLTNFKKRPIHNLSDGEKQKVLIARALVQDAPLLLLDEPTSHLDLENKVMVFEILKSISKEQNKMVIFSTHDINLVLPKTNKIWLNNLGGIKEINKNETKEIKQLFQNKYLKYDEKCQIFKWV